MGTTFVTATEGNTGDEVGFWMRDSMLELWLRLLALHLPEPTDSDKPTLALEIRKRWLLASRGYFNGHVPHHMEFACSSVENRNVVRAAINSLMHALNRADPLLSADVLNLLGNEGCRFVDIDRNRLLDVGFAFLDLLDGRIESTAHSTETMPGSKPYTRRDTN